MKGRMLPILLVAMLSGCSATETVEGPEGDEGPGVITDPRNITADDRPHVHDYWDGALEQEAFSGPFEVTMGAAGTCTLPPGQCFDFQFPEGQLVNPGAKWVNVSVSWQEPPTEPGLRLVWESAKERVDGALDLVNGGTHVINTSEAMNDPPHSLVSKWGFRIQPHSDTLPGATVRGTVMVTVARDSGPLPFAPAHPDPWRNATRIELEDDVGALGDYFGTLPPTTNGERAPAILRPDPVPPFTSEVHIKAWFNSSTPEALHYDPYLSWAGADRVRGQWEEDLRPPDDEEREPSSLFVEWRLDLEARMWDSPYSNHTSWTLWFYWSEPTDAAETRDQGRTYAMDGDYHIRIEALGDPEHLADVNPGWDP